MNHPGQQELFEYAGGGTAPARSAEIGVHLAACERCRNAADAIRRMDAALRSLPLEQPSPAFTRNLLNRLGLRESNPLWWMFLKNLAPVVAAALVAVVIITVGSAASGDSRPLVGTSLFDTAPLAGFFRGGLEAFTAWSEDAAARYLSSPLGGDTVFQIVFLALFLAGIGLLDRYLLGPLLRRRH